jgi:hypothetical protein
MIARKSMAIELLFDLLTDAGEGLGETAAEWLAEFPGQQGMLDLMSGVEKDTMQIRTRLADLADTQRQYGLAWLP